MATSSVPYVRSRDHESLHARGALDRLVATNASAAQLIARVVLGIVIFPHGAQKMLGWFGGHGISGTLGFFGSVGVPAPLAFLVICAEFFGSLMLILGLFTRFAALSIAAVMAGAVAMVHAPVGFFMNWTGAKSGEGYEFHLLAIGLALALVVAGGGALSADRAIFRNRLRR
jgi:putative oxidoreductase